MARKTKNKLPKGNVGKTITSILESRFEGSDEQTKDNLTGELSPIAQKYFDEYNSEENVMLRNFFTIPAINNIVNGKSLDESTRMIQESFKRDLDKCGFTIRDLMDKDFFEVMHMFYVKQKEISGLECNLSDEIQKKVDEIVIEAKAYITSEFYRGQYETDRKEDDILLKIEDFKKAKTLEELLYYAKRTTYSNKLTAIGIGKGLNSVIDDPSIELMDAYYVLTFVK